MILIHKFWILFVFGHPHTPTKLQHNKIKTKTSTQPETQRERERGGRRSWRRSKRRSCEIGPQLQPTFVTYLADSGAFLFHFFHFFFLLALQCGCWSLLHLTLLRAALEWSVFLSFPLCRACFCEFWCWGFILEPVSFVWSLVVIHSFWFCFGTHH